jgi:hypothetical protein
MYNKSHVAKIAHVGNELPDQSDDVWLSSRVNSPNQICPKIKKTHNNQTLTLLKDPQLVQNRSHCSKLWDVKLFITQVPITMKYETLIINHR